MVCGEKTESQGYLMLPKITQQLRKIAMLESEASSLAY